MNKLLPLIFALSLLGGSASYSMPVAPLTQPQNGLTVIVASDANGNGASYRPHRRSYHRSYRRDQHCGYRAAEYPYASHVTSPL
jgi:hypothetical protein